MRFSADEVIARLGEPADEFFLIRQGRIALEMPAPQGAVRVQTADAGETVGWSWLVKPYLWHYDLRAMTDVRAFSIDGTCLRQKCEDDPCFGFLMMKRFSKLMAARMEAMLLQLWTCIPDRPLRPSNE